MNKVVITKSIYIKYTRCPLSAWYEAFEKDAQSLSNTVIQRKRETQKLKEYAQKLFAGGYPIKQDTVDGTDYFAKSKESLYLLNEGKTVYDAVFMTKDCVATVDIAERSPEGLNIYMVKNATAPRDSYLHELAYIRYVATACGQNIQKCYLIVINQSYTRGAEVRESVLLRKIDLTKRVKKYEQKVIQNISAIAKFFAKGQKPSPQLNNVCEKQFGCDYYNKCFGQWLKEPSLFAFHGVDAKSKYDLYSKGIITIDDIRSNRSLLKPNFARLLDVYDKGEVIVKKAELKKFLSMIKYPLCFLDFESLQSAIPPYKGTKPLESIVFQYSLHRIDEEGGEVIHTGYLAKQGEDAREVIAHRLAQEIPDGACVLAFGKYLECKVLSQLAQMYPDVRAKLTSVKNNVRDIGAVFSKEIVYYPDMLGSASLKKVFHSVSPDKASGYDSGCVHNGADAMAIYLMLDELDEEQREQTRQSLWEYCKLDTLSLISILQDLKERVKD